MAETGTTKVTTRGTAMSKSDTAEPASLQSIDSKLNSIISILEKNTNDIEDIKKEQKELIVSVELCHGHISDIKQRVTEQDVKIAKCEEELLHATEKNYKMGKQLEKLRDEVRDLEQYSHRNNLIIYGIPEDKGENIHHVMRRLAGALQFPDWSVGMVDAVHRMGKIINSKPRPIIVKFVSRLDKEEFLNKRKVKRGLRAVDLGYSSEDPIYINESLTPANRELLKRTREMAKKKGYNSVWTANCSIFVRREKDSPAFRVSSATDLNRI